MWLPSDLLVAIHFLFYFDYNLSVRSAVGVRSDERQPEDVMDHTVPTFYFFSDLVIFLFFFSSFIVP